jgi:predicted negative regulator of RcsB-dependent stress response
VIVIVTAVILGTGLFFGYRYLQDQQQARMMRNAVEGDTFYEGIFVDNTSIGGMTRAQAMRLFVLPRRAACSR